MENVIRYGSRHWFLSQSLLNKDLIELIQTTLADLWLFIAKFDELRKEKKSENLKLIGSSMFGLSEASGDLLDLESVQTAARVEDQGDRSAKISLPYHTHPGAYIYGRR